MEESKSLTSHDNHVLKVIFLSLLIDLLGFTVILPLFPALMDFYESNDQGTLYSSVGEYVTSFRRFIGVPEKEEINSVIFGGFLGSLFSFLQFLNSPFFGAASDVYGRRPLILLSLIGTTVSYLLWAMSDTFALFLFARIIAGISEANVSICTAVVADLKSKGAKTRGMATIGIGFSIAFVFGPLLGAAFSSFVGNDLYFFRAPALLCFSIALLDILYVLKSLPETLTSDKRATSVVSSVKEVIFLLNPVSLFKFSAVKSVQNSPVAQGRLQRLGVVYFLYLFLFSGLEFTLTFLTHHRFQFSHMQQGKMFAFLGLTMAFVQGGYIRRVMEGKEKKLASMGFIILIPGFITVGLSSSILGLYLGLTCFAFAAASVVPCISSLTASHGLESEKGRVMGILRSLGALARATGPICASASYWLFGASFTYVTGGLLLVIPMILFFHLPSFVLKKD